MLQESAAPLKSGGLSYRKVWMKDKTEDGREFRYYVLVPLMSAKQDDSYKSDFFSFWDPIWRARVKRAIKSLNKTLQAFGMYMYAPASEVSDDDTEQVQEFIKAMYYQTVDPADIANWKAKRPLRVHYLAFAAMKYYRDMIFGGQSPLATPSGVSNYLYGTFGERILTADNWCRDWQPVWDKFLSVMNEMERSALHPVAVSLQEKRGDVAAG